MRFYIVVLAALMVALLLAHPVHAQGFSGPALIKQPTTADDCPKISADKSNVLVDSGIKCVGGTSAVTPASPGVTIYPNPGNGVFQIGDTKLIDLQTGAYTIPAVSGSKIVLFNSGSSIPAFLPQAGTTGYTHGWSVDIQNKGAGTVTITPTTSTINGSATLALTTNTGCTVTSDGANYQVSDCTALINTTGVVVSVFGRTGAVVAASNDYSFSQISGNAQLSQLASQGPNTILGNATSGAASPTSLSISDCHGANNAVIWTANTGFGCQSGLATLASPTFTGTVTLPSGQAIVSAALSGTITGTPTLSGLWTFGGGGRITQSGTTSSGAWTTTGVGIIQSATFNDVSTGSGTIAENDINVFGPTQTFNNTVTVTNMIGTHFKDPVAGSGATFTNKWAVWGDSLRVGTATQFTISTAGVPSSNGTAGVTCSGSPTGSFASTNGIVTHC